MPDEQRTRRNQSRSERRPLSECRKFSVAEVKRLCSFPDDFILTGDTRQQIERMGRAVPPLMMAAIAQTVRERIPERLPEPIPTEAP